MTRLEAAGLLDRAVAGLPDEAAIRARAAAGEGLTRPEVAALLPFAKLWLADAIEGSGLPDDPALAPLLAGYFPSALRERFASIIPRHRLRRELIATMLSNAVANRIGCAGLARLAGIGGDAAKVARAAWLAEVLFGLDGAAAEADAAPAPAAARLAALLGLRRLQEGAARELLGDPACLEGELAPARDALAPGIAALTGAARNAPGAEAGMLVASGIPEGSAVLAAAPGLTAAPAIVRLAREAGVPPEAASAAWSGVGEAFALDPLRAAAESARATGPFAARAKAEALAELGGLQARLARARLSGVAPEGALARDAAGLAREAAAGDLVAIGVAARALARLG
jgi:glutamate dehydrogenase